MEIKKAQVILKGRVHDNMSAVEYHNFKPELKELVLNTYRQLAESYELIVIEGAGAP
ncbi:MAG: Cobyric acid synthase [Dehalococcoidia bacterium]|nr:Cobyric acid synthase [Bacillota bacterium]